MTEVAPKSELVRELDKAWGELMREVEGVPEEACAAPGVVADWSVKDLMGHMAFWSGRAAHTLRCCAAGRPEDIEMGTGENWVDEWNEREYQARKDRSLSEVRAEWMRNHKNATEALDATPEDVLEQKIKNSPVLQYFVGDTTEHYREHAAQIRAWQQQTDTSEA